MPSSSSIVTVISDLAELQRWSRPWTWRRKSPHQPRYLDSRTRPFRTDTSIGIALERYIEAARGTFNHNQQKVTGRKVEALQQIGLGGVSVNLATGLTSVLVRPLG